MLKECFISNDIVTVTKACGKHALADVNCYCKMTSIMVLDDVMSFLCVKDVAYSCKPIQHSPTIGEFLQRNGGKMEETEDFKCVFRLFNVC